VGYERRAVEGIARYVPRDPFRPDAAQIIIIVLQLSESGARRAHLGPSGVRGLSARTSGVDAPASYASAPITIRDLD
jgi:hypothetical protein